MSGLLEPCSTIQNHWRKRQEISGMPCVRVPSRTGKFPRSCVTQAYEPRMPSSRCAIRPAGSAVSITLLALLSLSPVPAVAQPSEYYDEVGGLLYSIDAHGVVSMFETDALDNTVSVTRGTREALKPRITEISPASL